MRSFNLKICRINDIYTARYLARCGVDFLGLHAIFEMPTKKILEQFQVIISEMRKFYPWTRTVLVTRIEKKNDLISVYKRIPTDFIQISSAMNIKEKLEFLKKAKDIYRDVEIFNVLSATESDPYKISEEVLGSYVIIDKEFAGGTGEQIEKSIAKQVVSKLENKYILLAGGMGRINVESWLDGLDVKGVDIMSSLEFGHEDKRKDIQKIHNYLKSIYPFSNITMKRFPRDKNLKAKLCNSKGFPEDISEDYECLLLDYNSSFKQTLSSIREFSHFIPITIRIKESDYLYFSTLDLNLEGNNINSLCIYMSDFLKKKNREVYLSLRKKYGLSIFIDQHLGVDTMKKLKTNINLFEEVYVVPSSSLRDEINVLVSSSNPVLVEILK